MVAARAASSQGSGSPLGPPGFHRIPMDLPPAGTDIMSLRRALAFSYLEKYGTYGIGLISTVIISRLLGPADIGVFAVGMSVVGIVAVVRELGVSTYIVQEPELTEERVRAGFTLMSGMGLLLALMLALLSWPMGRFYGDFRVTQILLVLALGFALTPLGGISQALMVRELRFGALTWIRLVVAVASAVVSVAMVRAGLGPISLAWGSVAGAALNAVLSVAVRPHPMRLAWSTSDLRRAMSVGGPATVIAMIESFDASLPELLLGRLQNLEAAGLFSRAKGLSQMAHQMIARAAGPVFFTAFAAQQRDGLRPDGFYEKANVCVTAVGWTALGALAVLADPIVNLLFGAQWAAVVPLLRWLSVAAAIALLTSGANHLLLATGGARDAMWARIWSLPIFAMSLGIGGWFGAESMAEMMIVGTTLSSLLLLSAVKRRTGIAWSSQLSSLLLSLPVSIAGVVGASIGLLIPKGGPANSLVAVAVGGVACALLFLTVLRGTAHPLQTELRLAFRRKSS